MTKTYPFTHDYEVVTLEKFLEKVNSLTFNDKVYAYNALVEYKNDDTIYARKASAMLRGKKTKIALNNILLSAVHNFSWKVPIQELYEGMSVKYLFNYGTGKYIVKLGSRRYMVADVEDFSIILGNQGMTLVCFNHARLSVMEMYPITANEANEKAKKFTL